MEVWFLLAIVQLSGIILWLFRYGLQRTDIPAFCIEKTQGKRPFRIISGVNLCKQRANMTMLILKTLTSILTIRSLETFCLLLLLFHLLCTHFEQLFSSLIPRQEASSWVSFFPFCGTALLGLSCSKGSSRYVSPGLWASLTWWTCIHPLSDRPDPRTFGVEKNEKWRIQSRRL